MTETDILEKNKVKREYDAEACYSCNSISRRGDWVHLEEGEIEIIVNRGFKVKEVSCPNCVARDAQDMYDDIFPSVDSEKPYNPSTSEYN